MKKIFYLLMYVICRQSYCDDFGNIIMSVTSTSKEYWVPRVRVTVEVKKGDTVANILGQLCYIFHRSAVMRDYKENFPCETRSRHLLLHEIEKDQRIYPGVRDGKSLTLDDFNVRDNAEYLLYYS